MGSIIGFDFNVWEYEDDELVALANLLISPFAENLALDPLAINALNEAIEKKYVSLPYHNFRHALDVTQFVYELLQKKEVSNILDSWQQFFLILAALCHDIGHNGKDNEYQVAHKTSIFQKYGKDSPMEKYHVDVTLDILRQFDKELFYDLSEDLFENFLQILSEWILSTDISKHNDWMKKIKEANQLDPLLTGVMILKAADLCQFIRSNEAKTIWEERICEERYLQKKEEDLETNQDQFYQEFLQTQTAFFDSVAKPLYDLLCKKLHITLPY